MKSRTKLLTIVIIIVLLLDFFFIYSFFHYISDESNPYYNSPENTFWRFTMLTSAYIGIMFYIIIIPIERKYFPSKEERARTKRVKVLMGIILTSLGLWITVYTIFGYIHTFFTPKDATIIINEFGWLIQIGLCIPLWITVISIILIVLTPEEKDNIKGNKKDTNSD